MLFDVSKNSILGGAAFAIITKNVVNNGFNLFECMGALATSKAETKSIVQLISDIPTNTIIYRCFKYESNKGDFVLFAKYIYSGLDISGRTAYNGSAVSINSSYIHSSSFPSILVLLNKILKRIEIKLENYSNNDEVHIKDIFENHSIETKYEYRSNVNYKNVLNTVEVINPIQFFSYSIENNYSDNIMIINTDQDEFVIESEENIDNYSSNFSIDSLSDSKSNSYTIKSNDNSDDTLYLFKIKDIISTKNLYLTELEKKIEEKEMILLKLNVLFKENYKFNSHAEKPKQFVPKNKYIDKQNLFFCTSLRKSFSTIFYTLVDSKYLHFIQFTVLFMLNIIIILLIIYYIK